MELVVLLGWYWGGAFYGAVNAHTSGKLLKSKPQAPVLNGYALECLRVDSADDTVNAGDVALFAVPISNRASAGDVGDLFEVAKLSGVNALIFPAAVAQASMREPSVPVRNLSHILNAIKPGVVKSPDNNLQHIPFQTIGSEQLHTMEEGQLTGILAALGAKFPNMAPVVTMPQTSAEVHELARQLRPLAIRSVEDHLEVEILRTVDDEGAPGKTRLSKFTLPARDDDPFEPSVWVQYANNPGGVTATKHTVASFTDKNTDVSAIISKGHIQTNEVLPVLAKTYQELRALDRRLQAEANRPAQADEQAVDYVPRIFEPIKPIHENRKAWTMFKKAAGAAALFGVLGAGEVTALELVVGGSSPAPATVSSGTARVGEALGIGAHPSWKVEGHGLNAAGYYPGAKFYHLDSDLTWSRPEETVKPPIVVPEIYTGSDPHIEVEGYIEPQNIADTFLPIKDMTDIDALHVTTSDNQTVPVQLVQSADGTTSLHFKDTPDHTIHVEYTLTARPETDAATQEPIIDDTPTDWNNYNSNGDYVFGERRHILRNYAYDNTEALGSLIDSAASPEDLYYRVNKAEIANCNVAATEVAIAQYRGVSDMKLAYTTGYEIPGDGYMNIGHAWVTTDHIVDATPPLRGRTSADAGVPEIPQAELDAAWNAKSIEYDQDKPIHLPWDKLPITILGGLVAMNIVRPLRYVAKSATARRDSRHMTAAQAERILAHGMYGNPEDLPSLNPHEIIDPVTGSAERIGASSLPANRLIEIASNPRDFAPYLSRTQARSLKRHINRFVEQQSEGFSSHI